MNPEFQRNIWLEASPRRIAWAGVVLALIFGATALVTKNEGALVAKAMSGVGVGIFVLCAVMWGARAAGTAVISEISDRTWDFQRLSALTPWAMTWGKLFGATSLAWLCGLTGLAVMALAALVDGEPDKGWSLVQLLAIALLVQAISMVAALIGVRKARAEGRIARAGGVLGGLIIGILLLFSIGGASGFQHGMGLTGITEMLSSHATVLWWSASVPGDLFRAVAGVVFAAWALAGAWRLMRLELQMQNTPLVWPGFLLFLALFTAGFQIAQGGLTAGLVSGALIVALCAYGAAFADPADRVRLRQFAESTRRGDLKRAAPIMPAVLAPVILTILLVIVAAVAMGPLPDGSPAQSLGVRQAVALIAFMIRDLGVIAFFRFGPRPQRGDFGAVVALALLYGIGGIVGGSIGKDFGFALFTPLGEATLVSVLSGGVQAVLAWTLAVRRIRAPEAKLSAPAPSAPASAPAS